MPRIVGRDPERAVVELVLDAGLERFAALIVEGDAGIGKTTVWRDATRAAAERGYLVLACRPAEAEAALAFASLADLLEPIGDEVLASLPEPQRHALAVALLRAGPSGVAPQARAVAAGVVSVLRGLARRQPVLVAIDDVQWLDRQTEAALAFAVRRLSDERIAVVLSERGSRTDAALGLDHEPAERVKRVRLGPLNLGALYHLLRSHLEIVYPRPVLQRIERASGGNPLYALELARAHDALERRPSPGEPLPTGRLTDLIAARIARLPAATRDALLAIASISDATETGLRGAIGEAGLAALGRAERAGLIERAGDRIRFAHPLYATAVVAKASADERRAMHRRLADSVPDPEQRAWHLALGSDEPDEEVAAALEAAAERTASRGAPDAGCELLELAIAKTPAADGAGVARRRLELAELSGRAGATEDAKRHLAAVLDTASEGWLRARALEQRARIAWSAGTTAEAVAACEEALREADLPDELRARIHATRSIVEVGDPDEKERHARIALELVERSGAPDPTVHAQTVFACIDAELALGRPLPADLVEQGLELERVAPNPVVADRLSAALGAIYKYAGDFGAARRWLELTHRAAIDEADEGSLPYAVSHLPQLELWSGDWPAAERWAREHLDLAERTGQDGQRLQAVYNLSLVLAHRGRIDEASRLAAAALGEAVAIGADFEARTLAGMLGFAALSIGDREGAVRHLAHSHALHQKMRDLEPRRQMGDYAEALAAAGQAAEAARMAHELERRARAAVNVMLLPNALRARAIAAATQGDFDEARRAVEEALVAHREIDVPFDRARTLLAAGQLRRRSGERRAAREALTEARDIFRRLGAPLWERRAGDELGRIPIRRAAGDRLTEAEARVAALVGEGRTNREIANELFVSPKTVEANLTRVYAKLGVRSRAELTARMAGSGPEEAATKL